MSSILVCDTKLNLNCSLFKINERGLCNIHIGSAHCLVKFYKVGVFYFTNIYTAKYCGNRFIYNHKHGSIDTIME